MTSEGSLSVRLTVSRGAVVDVAVASTRMARASRVLAGRDAGEVLRVVPLLFPVCGVAQAVACARAIDAACGTSPDPYREMARALACLVEAAASHVWQLAITWPEAAQVPSDVATVRAARAAVAAFAAAVFVGGVVSGPLRAPPAWDEARAAARSLVTRLEGLATGGAPLLDAVVSASRAAFGPADTNPVATLDEATVGALLAGDPAFSEHPELGGAPIDVSAYARQRDDAAVRAAEAAHGPGLLTRLVARRADALACARRLRDLVDATSAGNARDASAGDASPGAGTGSADTARGPLVYWVRATPALVEDVRVVAPTDWTFHAAGALRCALLGVEAGLSLARDAGWLVLALDPCVPCTVEVRDA